MVTLYKGVSIDSYWYHNDPRLKGLEAHARHLVATNDRLMYHISRGTTYSPYISLTRSFNVAWDYAYYYGARRPTRSDPAYVYEIVLDPLPRGVALLDPAMEIIGPLHAALHYSATVPYLHDGSQKFAIGVASNGVLRRLSRHLMSLPYRQPPPSSGTPRPPNLPIELETLIRSLRDTEVLCLGTIPASCVINRIDAYA